MENKSVNAHDFITCDTHSVNQVLFVTESAQCGKKPAVSIESLTNIAGCRIVFEKYRFLEYVGDAFDRSREILVVVVRLQAVQTISPVSFEIKLNVEMPIAVFGIDPSAFFCNFGHR